MGFNIRKKKLGRKQINGIVAVVVLEKYPEHFHHQPEASWYIPAECHEVRLEKCWWMIQDMFIGERKAFWWFSFTQGAAFKM